MNKKRLILKIIVTLMAVLLVGFIIIYFSPFKTENIGITLNVETDADEGDMLQIYYATENDDGYSEAQSFTAEMTNMSSRISMPLPLNTHCIRIDTGNTLAAVSISNIEFEICEYSFSPDDEQMNRIMAKHDVDDFYFENGKTVIKNIGGDPFFEWEISNFEINSQINMRYRICNIAVKILASIVVLWGLWHFWRKFNTLYEFLSEVINSRKLITELSVSDFKSRFAGSYLGVVWAFIQPVITILVYWFAFEKGLHASSVSDVPYVLWLMAGMVQWFFFSEALSGATNSLVEYQYLVKKVVFPIDILPIVKILGAIVINIVFVVITVLLYTVYGHWPGIYVLQLIYYMFCTFILVMGLSYITSALVVFFRDLNQIIGIVLQVGMWVTPILWNIDTLDISENLKTAFKINPFYYISNGFRDSLIYRIPFWERPGLTLFFWMFALLQFGIGITIFKKLKGHFADIL